MGPVTVAGVVPSIWTLPNLLPCMGKEPPLGQNGASLLTSAATGLLEMGVDWF